MRAKRAREGESAAPSSATLDFDPAATSVDAIQRAAYRFSDRLSIDLQVGTVITVVVHPSYPADLFTLTAEFRNEVLDQTLRERIRIETESARNLILALAFSRTGLLPEE